MAKTPGLFLLLFIIIFPIEKYNNDWVYEWEKQDNSEDVFFPSFYFACLTDIILHYGEHDYCHNCLTGTKGLQMFD